DAESERRFSAPNCVELAEATALITAVALDPLLVARQVATEREASSSEHPDEPLDNPPDAPPDDPPDDTPTPTVSEPTDFNFDLVLTATDEPALPPRTVELGVGVFGTGAWGPATAGFGGIAGSFAVFAERWRWQLEGGWSIPRTLALADGRRGRVQAWHLGTRGCVVPRLGAIELPVCPGVEAGMVFARGLPPTTNTLLASQPWAAVVIGQGLRWPIIPRLALTAEAAVLISLVRGRFLIGDQTLSSLTPVGFRGALGLEARF